MKIENCPICGSKRLLDVHENIKRCCDCTHAFKVEIPDEVMDKYYDRQYWNNDKQRQGVKSVKDGDYWTKWVNARMSTLNEFGLLNHEHPENINILEFGCAEGRLLYELKKMGYNVFGNDVCAVLEDGKSEYGIEISMEPIEKFVERNIKFDIIMSWHVVEHLRDPRNVMEKLGGMLKDTGIMLMHVPVDDREFGNPDHFHFFTEKSCTTLMELITRNIRSDVLFYNNNKENCNNGIKMVAATFVGIKK